MGAVINTFAAMCSTGRRASCDAWDRVLNRPPRFSVSLSGIASCAYHALRKGEVDLEHGEQVQILDVHSGFSHVLKENGTHGNVPSYFLELDDIPGDTLAEQISYRRMWHTLVDEVAPVLPSSSPLSPQQSPLLTGLVLDRRPVFVVPLTDVSVCEGDVVVLEPKISSASSFTATWRGPAVQAGRARVECDDGRTRLTIERAVPLDGGPYSVIAENEYGTSSSLAVMKVVVRPEAPTAVVCERIGRNALLLSWSQGARGGCYFCVEYKSEEMPYFRCAASALRSTTISMRHFRPVRYRIRIFAYNFNFRSRPTEEVEVDFRREVSLLENASDLSNSFKLGEVCGRGRSSVVYEATHLKTQRSLVVKVLAEGRAKEDAEREVAILSTLHHANMPRLKGIFVLDNRYCIAMKRMVGVPISIFVEEFVHGREEGGHLEKLMQHLSTDILSALSYLHTRNIAHLDVKPANLLVSDHVSLVDFGCARFVDAADLDWGDGDKSYSAPERIAGKQPSTKSDIWSFGAVLFEVCFGVAPHRMLTTLTMNAERRSPALLSFLNEVLALEAARRPSAEECMQHQWFEACNQLRVPHERREFKSRSASFEG
ncbi:hypothetical protein Y032_0001g359 [Ancylostoma ceylanicum]|uniref:Protein kinase domain-containing protein n=2 Tax=Ancylostoma ceylanicum TaxID=53326 RepID=A0A016W5L6_9BILA|nr:hypothetical protein Y032_0001g359 [Ancylostoma ceylanicum]